MDDFPSNVTIGDKYDPAMAIKDQAEADAYFERCVTHTMRYGKCTRQTAEEIERANLGYYAGYGDSNTRERVERLFHCEHPVFGKIAEHGRPSPEAAILAGVMMAKRTPVRTYHE